MLITYYVHRVRGGKGVLTHPSPTVVKIGRSPVHDKKLTKNWWRKKWEKNTSQNAILTLTNCLPSISRVTSVWKWPTEILEQVSWYIYIFCARTFFWSPQLQSSLVIFCPSSRRKILHWKFSNSKSAKTYELIHAPISKPRDSSYNRPIALKYITIIICII